MKLLFCALACLGLTRAPLAAELPYPWKAAVASEKITPPSATWLAGYASRKSPSEGVLTDLHAKALAIEDADGTRLVILTFDLIGIPKDLRREVEALAESRYGLPPANLVLNASHTHSGPVLSTWQWPGTGEIRAAYTSVSAEENERRVEKVHAYRAFLAGKIETLLARTLGEGELEPVSLSWSHARCGFAMNRRTPGGDAWKNHPYPEGPVDHRVPVLSVTRSRDDSAMAVMFGYACHATTLGTMQVNADWPGYAQAAFERDHPGSVALFLNGASADQNPYPRRMERFAQRHGQSLATAVEAARQTSPNGLVGPLKAAIAWPEIPYAEPPTRESLETLSGSENGYEARYAALLLATLESDGTLPKSYPVPVQAIQFGDGLTLVTMGGEVVVDYALRLRKEYGEATWFAGYSNDVMTYLPSERVLAEGGYEGGGARIYARGAVHPAAWAPGLEDRLFSELEQLMDELSTR